MADYLHLYLKDAKVNIVNNYKKLNISKNFGKEVRKINNKNWNKIPDYAKKRNSEFESWIQSAMNNSSYNSERLGAAQISSAVSVGDFSGIASKIGTIRTDANLLKQAVHQLNQALTILDKADKQISQHILELALSNPYIKQMLQISIPDGVYQIDPNFRVNESIQTALETAKANAQQAISFAQSMSCNSGIGSKEDDALASILAGIENVISSNRGFLYEVEILEGLLLSVKKGHSAVVHTGSIGKSHIDPKFQEELNKADSLLGQLSSIVSSIGVSNPKADLMCSINQNGAVLIFGISVKSISPSKFNAIQSGSGAKNVSINFGSTYKTLQQIFDEHGSIISEAIGGYDPSWYGAQILTGWEESHKMGDNTVVDGGGGQYTAAWNQILNLCAMLTFSDALVGISEKTLQGGFATYLVINNQVYWMKDVLNKAALAIEKGETPGIYGKTTSILNRKWGQELQQRSYVKDFIGPTKVSYRRAAALQRSNNIWSEWNAQMEKQILKVNMSLGALKTIADKAGLAPIF